MPVSGDSLIRLRRLFWELGTQPIETRTADDRESLRQTVEVPRFAAGSFLTEEYTKTRS
jgi:hypothetical protein